MSLRRSQLSRRIELLESRRMLAPVFRVQDNIDDGDITNAFSLSWAIEGANIWNDPARGPLSLRNNPNYGAGTGVITSPIDFTNAPTIEFLVPVLPQTSDKRVVLFDFLDGLDGPTNITAPGDPVIIDATLDDNGAAPTDLGIRMATEGSNTPASVPAVTITNIVVVGFDTAALSIDNGGNFDIVIDGVSAANNNAAGIAITDIPNQTGSVTIKNSNLAGNEGGISISDANVPASTGLIKIEDNTIYDEESFGILLGSNVKNVEIKDNDIVGVGVPGIQLEEGVNDVQIYDDNGIDTVNAPGISLGTGVNNVQIYDNTNISSDGAAAIAIGANVSNVQVTDNALLAINESPITVSPTAGNGLRFSYNTYRVEPLATTVVVPPIDLLNDNIFNLPDSGDVDTGPNGLLNAPVILTDEVYQTGGNYIIPFKTDFNATGNYRFELYKLNTSTKTWSPIANTTLNVATGVTRKTISVSTSSVALGEIIAMVAIGETGTNTGNTSEFGFASQTTVHLLQNFSPRIWDVGLRSTTWANGVSYRYSDVANYEYQSQLYNGQTAPMPFTGTAATDGVDTIDVVFSEPVNISTSNLRIRTSDPLNPYITPTGSVVTNSDGNPLTHDYRFIFATDLPSDKYVLEIDADVTDLGTKRLDGEWDIDYGLPDDFIDDSLPPNDGFISGNGIEDGDFRFRFAILYGDANLDGFVTAADKLEDLDINLSGGASNAADDAIIDAIIANGVTRLITLQNGGGDLNDDEIVDWQDFAIWQTGYGATDEGDLDGDGDSDGRDFLIWERVYGDESAWHDSGALVAPLTVGLPPQVMNVIVSSSVSTHPSFSFDTVDGSGTQLASVPVAFADTISIVFSESVNVLGSDLIVVGMTTANVPELAEFTYDAATNTATWRFEGWVLADNFLLYLSDRVTDVEGNHLDGEWTNPASRSTTNSLVSEFPSGDGISGGAFIFAMTLLPGDANGDGIADTSDYYIWTSNAYGPAGKLFTQGDFDGNGYVDTGDVAILYAHMNQNLQNPFLQADVDEDGDVDEDDLDTISSNYGMTGATWAHGDLNGTGTIDDADLDLAFAQYGLNFTNFVA